MVGSMIPVPLCKYGAGDVLGFDEGDNGKTSNVETWSICKGPVEVILMTKKDFSQLWKLHDKSVKMIRT